MRAALSDAAMYAKIDAVISDLVDIMWSALAVGKGYSEWKSISHDIDQLCGDNLSRATLMHEVHIIHRLSEIMGEVSVAAAAQAREGLSKLATFELATPVSLSVPTTRHEKIRRYMLRAMFNAAHFLDDDGKRQSADLGRLWFASEDDGQPLIKSTAELRRRAKAKFKASKLVKSKLRNERTAEKRAKVQAKIAPRPTGWTCVNVRCSLVDVKCMNAGNCVSCGSKLLR